MSMRDRPIGVPCKCPHCEHEWSYRGRATPQGWITCPNCHRKSALMNCMLYSSAEDELFGGIQDLVRGLGVQAVVTRRMGDAGEEILVVIEEEEEEGGGENQE